MCCQECASSLRKSNLSFDSTDKYVDANIDHRNTLTKLASDEVAELSSWQMLLLR